MNNEQKNEAVPPVKRNNWRIAQIAALSVIALVLASMFIFTSVINQRYSPNRSVPHKSSCINNLRQIDGAKEQWALENKKIASDTPVDSDLIGTDKYIKVKPTCPQGGTYSYNNMITKPSCNAHAKHSDDHILQ